MQRRTSYRNGVGAQIGRSPMARQGSGVCPITPAHPPHLDQWRRLPMATLYALLPYLSERERRQWQRSVTFVRPPVSDRFVRRPAAHALHISLVYVAVEGTPYNVGSC